MVSRFVVKNIEDDSNKANYLVIFCISGSVTFIGIIPYVAILFIKPNP